jgi:hypothetical protein
MLLAGSALAVPAQATTWSINDQTVTEGGTATFTVTRADGTNGRMKINYATANGSALSGSDYTARNGTLTFNSGVATQTFTINTIQNTTPEPTETFNVNLSNPSKGTISDGQGVGTILDNDATLPTLSIANVSQGEGNSGTSTMTFTVTLSAAAPTGGVTFNFATANGTATAGTSGTADYVAASGSRTIAAGSTTATIPVTLRGDATVEPNETFTVNITGATNTTNTTASATGTIVNDDGAPLPSISINDASVTEGQTANFTVSLSAASTQTVTVNFATANGTAGLSDYNNTNGTLTFPAQTTTQTISVPTINDTAVESTETFVVNLSGPTNATIADPQGQGTIIDNDGGTTPNTSINSTSQSSFARVTSVVPQQSQVANTSYSVLAINDLGMHCGDLDTRIASILPPFQVLLSQVIQKGTSPTLNPAGVSLSYSAAANANDPILSLSGVLNGVADDGSTYKTNFWDVIPAGTYDPFYPAYNPLVGPSATLTPLAGPPFNVTADTGLPVPNVEKFYIGTDGQLGGTDVTLDAVLHAMPGQGAPYSTVSGNAPQLVQEHYTNKPFFTNFAFGYVAANVDWFEGAGIPFSAFDDVGRENAYPLVRVQAKNAGGTVLSTVDTVLPISGEASCTNCHADPADVQNSRSSAPTDALTAANLPVALSIQDPDSNMPSRVSVEYAADINVLRLHDLKHGASYVSTACDTAGENCLNTAAAPCTITSATPNGTANCLTNKALVQGKPVVCQVCHYTPALDLAQLGPLAGATGTIANGRNQVGHQSNSRVMHNHHGGFTSLFTPIPAPTQDANGNITNQAARLAALEDSCYQCHPGKNTKCLRGAMFNGGMLCNDCHGSMLQVGNDFSRTVSPSNAGTFILAKDFYTNANTPRVPWANEPGCGSCHTGDAVSRVTTGTGLVVNNVDSNGFTDGMRLRQAFRSTDAKATPIVPTNKRFAEPVVPASFNGTPNKGAGNPQLYRVSSGHGGVMCEGCHGATHAEWPNANPNANDNVTANQLQGHSGTITDCTTCHGTTNPGNNLNGPHGLHPIAAGSTPWSSSSNHSNLGSNYTANCQACHGGTSRDQSCGTPLSRALNNRTFSGRAVAKGQPVGCSVCHNSSYWTGTCVPSQ